MHAGWKFGLAFLGSAYTHDYDYLPKKAIVQGYKEDVLEKWMEILAKKKESGSTSYVIHTV